MHNTVLARFTTPFLIAAASAGPLQPVSPGGEVAAAARQSSSAARTSSPHGDGYSLVGQLDPAARCDVAAITVMLPRSVAENSRTDMSQPIDDVEFPDHGSVRTLMGLNISDHMTGASTEGTV